MKMLNVGMIMEYANKNETLTNPTTSSLTSFIYINHLLNKKMTNF